MLTLMTVDLQPAFMEGGSRIANPAKAACLPATWRLLQHARASGWRVVHVITRHSDTSTIPRHQVDEGWPPYCVGDSRLNNLIPDLRDTSDRLTCKTKYSAFVTPGADELVGTEDLVVCGISTDCCVLHTVFDASTRYDKRVIVPFDCVAAGASDTYAFGLKAMAKSAATIVASADLLVSESLPAKLTQASVERYGSWFEDESRRAIQFSARGEGWPSIYLGECRT